ncbi:CidA/LrgA family protein [Shewanella xiamenensis]|jgi:holin-like protein|uniref:CidA/LrgA family protein n=1 Tax=Shewanella xiamenensis TaxID=332186 RepID=A0A1E3UZ06_9GAMM|nr:MULTISPECIES: CidA/LrgA family protein [Shewanella]PZP27478.1 MAG: murein hydrolase transporter LrgA [Shewanella oneidensis]ASF17228.1 murein hydrolase transporter LrgA [Shewanella sp. FDAARGOS_354]MBW0280333.1 murein hydrolase transporter LrgA [Shewanella xiamenensis]MCH7424670.1 CidA/LrgA family protein [Shewanella sp. MM_2022_3]MCL1070327.1 CidA/LrgA family protein [Shewanella xiamenensis]
MSFLQAAIRRCRHGALLLTQIGLFCLLSFACHWFASWAHSPVPGSVLGLGLLLILLATKLIPENAVQLGAAWLIGELLLFFIPPVISVIKYEGLFEQYGLNILFTLVMGSVCVMVGTGFVVDRVFRFERQLNIKKHARRHAKAV